MPRIGILNLVIGFAVIFLAASAGALIATDMTEAFISAPQRLSNWQMTLQKTAHGHSNLFGMLHITLGLTLAYSRLNHRVKALQTLGLFLGTIAMGPLMYIRSGMGPTDSVDFVTVLTGIFLSAALASIAVHTGGLAARLIRP